MKIDINPGVIVWIKSGEYKHKVIVPETYPDVALLNFLIENKDLECEIFENTGLSKEQIDILTMGLYL